MEIWEASLQPAHVAFHSKKKLQQHSNHSASLVVRPRSALPGLSERRVRADVAENIFSRVIIELEEEDALDEWRLSILHIIAQRSFFPTDQLECLLATFRWPRQRAEAVVLMYGSLTNPQDLFQVTPRTTAQRARKRIHNCTPVSSLFLCLFVLCWPFTPCCRSVR